MPRTKRSNRMAAVSSQEDSSTTETPPRENGKLRASRTTRRGKQNAIDQSSVEESDASTARETPPDTSSPPRRATRKSKLYPSQNQCRLYVGVGNQGVVGIGVYQRRDWKSQLVWCRWISVTTNARAIVAAVVRNVKNKKLILADKDENSPSEKASKSASTTGTKPKKPVNDSSSSDDESEEERQLTSLKNLAKKSGGCASTFLPVKKAKLDSEAEDESKDQTTENQSSAHSSSSDDSDEERPLRKAPNKSSGKSSKPEDDGSDTLYCVCRGPYDNRFMVGCDKCPEWYHGECVGITKSEGKRMEQRNEDWVCPKCREAAGETVVLPNKAKRTLSNQEIEQILSESSSSSGDEDEQVENVPKAKLPELKKKPAISSDVFENALREAVSSQPPASSNTTTSDVLKPATLKSSTDHVKTIVTDIFGDPDVNEKKKQEILKKLDKKKNDSSGGPQKSSKSAKTAAPAPKIAPPPPVKKVKPDKIFCLTCKTNPVSRGDFGIYCSEECIRKHVTQSVAILKKLAGKTNSIDPIPLSTVEKTTGRLVSESRGLTDKKVLAWLIKHPTFQIHTPLQPKEKPEAAKPADSVKQTTASFGSKDESFRNWFRVQMKESLETRASGCEDVMVSTTEIRRIAINVEDRLFSHFGEVGEKYKARMRSILSNVKDFKNKGLFRRILLGKVSPDALVTMPVEKLASGELRAWREQESKHYLDLLKEQGETTKFEDELVLEAAAAKNPSLQIHSKDPASKERDRLADHLPTHFDHAPEDSTPFPLPPLAHSSTLHADTTSNHASHLFDMNCRICMGGGGNSSNAKSSASNAQLPPKTYSDHLNIEDVAILENLDTKGKLFDEEIPLPPPEPLPPSPVVRTPRERTTPRSNTRTPGSDRSLSPPSPIAVSITPADIQQYCQDHQSDPVWSGCLVVPQNMAACQIGNKVTEYHMKGFIAFALHCPVLDDLPPTLTVAGRLSSQQIWEYLPQIKKAKNKDVLIMNLEPDSLAMSRKTYDELSSYLSEKDRVFAVGNCGKTVKDLYILSYTAMNHVHFTQISLEPFLEPDNLSLVAVIVRYTDRPHSSTQTEKMNLHKQSRNTPPKKHAAPSPPPPVTSMSANLPNLSPLRKLPVPLIAPPSAPSVDPRAKKSVPLAAPPITPSSPTYDASPTSIPLPEPDDIEEVDMEDEPRGKSPVKNIPITSNEEPHSSLVSEITKNAAKTAADMAAKRDGVAAARIFAQEQAAKVLGLAKKSLPTTSSIPSENTTVTAAPYTPNIQVAKPGVSGKPAAARQFFASPTAQAVFGDDVNDDDDDDEYNPAEAQQSFTQLRQRLKGQKLTISLLSEQAREEKTKQAAEEAAAAAVDVDTMLEESEGRTKTDDEEYRPSTTNSSTIPIPTPIVSAPSSITSNLQKLLSTIPADLLSKLSDITGKTSTTIAAVANSVNVPHSSSVAPRLPSPMDQPPPQLPPNMIQPDLNRPPPPFAPRPAFIRLPNVGDPVLMGPRQPPTGSRPPPMMMPMGGMHTRGPPIAPQGIRPLLPTPHSNGMMMRGPPPSTHLSQQNLAQPPPRPSLPPPVNRPHSNGHQHLKERARSPSPNDNPSSPSPPHRNPGTSPSDGTAGGSRRSPPPVRLGYVPRSRRPYRPQQRSPSPSDHSKKRSPPRSRHHHRRSRSPHEHRRDRSRSKDNKKHSK